MLMKIYRLFSDIFSLLIFFFFLVRLTISKEKIDSILEKFLLRCKKRPVGNLVWINGVSIGEAKTGLIIADQIKRINPGSQILFSTSTITSYNLISKMNKDYILIYSPIDINFVIKKFIKYWKPSSAIFIESEIWPNIFYHLKKNSIKLTLFNARISRKSFFKWDKISFFSKQVFELIDGCFVQDNESINRFAKLGVKKIKKIENLKFLSEELTFDKNKFLSFKNQLKNKRVVTLFSSHENEEEIFLECHNILSKKINNLFFIIIPRHINRVKRITQEFTKKKQSFLLQTKGLIKIKKEKFMIVDTFGELGLFFKLSEVVIVGGSFCNKGGHNPIETRNFGCSLIFGPNMENFKDIRNKILKSKAGFEVKNLNQLIKQLSKILENKKLNIQTHKNFNRLCKVQSEKSKSILSSILKC